MDKSMKKIFFIGFGCAVGVLIFIAVIFFAGMHLGKKENIQDTPTMAEKNKNTKTQESETREMKITDTPIISSNLVISNGVIFFASDERFCSALVEGDGTLTEVVPEGTFSDEPMSFLISDDYLYFTIPDGIYRLNLRELGQAELLSKDGSFGRITLCGDSLYYIEDSCVCKIPKTGGASEVLTPPAADYVVTGDGIYYTSGNGKLYQTDLDGTHTMTVTDMAKDGRLMLYRENIFIFGTEGIQCLKIPDRKKETLPLESVPEINSNILVTDNFLLFDTGKSVRKYDFTTKKESDVPNGVYLPDPKYSQVYEGFLYYHLSREITAINLSDFERTETDVDAILEPDGKNFEETFDIAANLYGHTSEGNIAFVASDNFIIYLDYDDFSNGLWGYEATSPNSMTFYYVPAREAGFGGDVFYLSAYDWGVNDYDSLPSYEIAGLTDTKKYIVSFPTDVQYDASSPTQSETYARLSEYAHRISKDNPMNPFSAAP